jgi:DNA-3-methyladenine glycosylase II
MAGNSDLVSLSPEEVVRGIAHLRERDPIIAQVIDRAGPFALKPDKDLFKSLVRAIIAQQISTAAARSICQKLLNTVGGEKKLLPRLLRMTDAEFKAAGLSSQKTRYLRDLAEKVSHKTVRIHLVERMTNDQAISELTQIIGVGKWTVQMLLIFSLGRLDVFPGDDLGVRTAIKKLYRKRLLPKPRHLTRYEKLWQPYATIASWYCWRSLEFDD